MSTKQTKILFDHLITKPPNSYNAYCIEIDENDYWIPANLPEEKGYIFVNEEENFMSIPEWMCIAKGLEDYII